MSEWVRTNGDAGECSALFAPLKYPFVLDAPNGDRHGGRRRRRSMTMTLTDQVRFPLGCRRLTRGSERAKRGLLCSLGLARENIVNVATVISPELSTCRFQSALPLRIEDVFALLKVAYRYYTLFIFTGPILPPLTHFRPSSLWPIWQHPFLPQSFLSKTKSQWRRFRFIRPSPRQFVARDPRQSNLLRVRERMKPSSLLLPRRCWQSVFRVVPIVILGIT